MSLQPGQKTVLITGCTPGGIGYALCLAFQMQGYHVIATARKPAVIADLAEKGMSIFQLDVTSQESIVACRKQVQELTGGTLDMLINNAGRTHTVPATDLDMDDVRQTFETNVFGVMAMVKAFMPLLIPTKGLIVNVASLSAVTPYVFAPAYCASKGALVSYSRTLRVELRPFGVRVMVAMAGTISSNINFQTKRELPADSLYQPIEDRYRWRLTFSAKHASMPCNEFARQLVAATQRWEAPVWLRTWFGRPDWLWAGGFASLAWVGTVLGEWVLDTYFYYRFGLRAFERLLRRQEAEAKKGN